MGRLWPPIGNGKGGAMSIKARLERLERRMVDDDERVILFIDPEGHKLPQECKEALIAKEASWPFTVIFGFERTEDGCYLCRHCGQEHCEQPSVATCPESNDKRLSRSCACEAGRKRR